MTRSERMWNRVKTRFVEWNEDKAPRLAAALAYYALFAIAPLLINVMAIAGLIFGQEAARGQIVWQIQDASATDWAGAQASFG
jgi:membrane protein